MFTARLANATPELRKVRLIPEPAVTDWYPLYPRKGIADPPLTGTLFALTVTEDADKHPFTNITFALLSGAELFVQADKQPTISNKVNDTFIRWLRINIDVSYYQ